MSENRVDLKKLLLVIDENKNVNTNLCLDEGCTLETADAKPLVKVINYILNYLEQLTNQPLEISLDLRQNDYLLSLMAYTDKSEFPALSDQLDGALKSYNASLDKILEAGKYAQIKIAFAK